MNEEPTATAQPITEESEPVWTRSTWAPADLDGQTVEFRLPLKNGNDVAGLGVFMVLEDPQDWLCVQIRVDLQGRHWAERIVQDFVLPQAAVDRIAEHSDQSVARFQLI